LRVQREKERKKEGQARFRTNKVVNLWRGDRRETSDVKWLERDRRERQARQGPFRREGGERCSTGNAADRRN